MKKFLLTFLLSMFYIFSFGQETYKTEMTETISKLNSAKTSDEMAVLKNDFAKIIGSGNADWHAYYYAAVALIRQEMILQRDNKTQGIELVVASAEKYLSPIINQQKENAEINILMAEINLLRAMNDNNTKSLQKAKDFLSKAELKDKNNPRIDLVKGEINYFSPLNLNGSKEVAKKHFENAVLKFKVAKKTTELSPNWGSNDVAYFISSIK